MSTRNVAVFIDAENLFKGYGKLDIPDISMEDVLEQLEKAASLAAGAGSIGVSRAYADWNALGLEDFRRDVERAGVQTVQVFSVSKAEKNAADIVLVVDALRVAAELDHIEVFIIVSADGDFVPLVRRLHELDKYVVGATLPGHTANNVLEREVDQYVTLKLGPKAPPPEGLAPVFSADLQAAPAKRAPRRSAADDPAPVERRRTTKRVTEPHGDPQPDAARGAAQPAKAKQDGKKSAPGRSPVQSGAKTKTSWHEMAKDIPVVHEGPASSPDDYKAIVKQVLSDPKVRSFCDKLADQGGTLPILAMAIKAAAPELSPSDARVGSLSRALRFALAGTQYALARESDDVQPVLVRRNANPPNMLPDLSLDDIARGVQ